MEWNEPKCDFLIAEKLSKTDISKRFWFKIYRVVFFFELKSDTLLNFLLEIWQNEKKIFQSSTRYFFFKSKSDALYIFQFEIWHVMKFSLQNHAF